MGKWITAHRRIVALGILAVAYAAGAVLFVSWGHELTHTLFTAALGFAFAVVAWHLDARRQRKTADMMARQGGFLVYCRDPDARPGSLRRIWDLGVAVFDKTASTKIQPADYDTLEPSGPATTFTALAAVSAEPRKIGWKERWHVTRRASRPSDWPPTRATLKWPPGPNHFRRSSTSLPRTLNEAAGQPRFLPTRHPGTALSRAAAFLASSSPRRCL
jgi:hypothetical protein